jgi:hypothetical protein
MFIKTGLGQKTSYASSSGVGVCRCHILLEAIAGAPTGEERMGSHIPVATSYLH